MSIEEEICKTIYFYPCIYNQENCDPNDLEKAYREVTARVSKTLRLQKLTGNDKSVKKHKLICMSVKNFII